MCSSEPSFADGRYRVALIEAGGKDINLIHIPGIFKTMGNPNTDCTNEADPP